MAANTINIIPVGSVTPEGVNKSDFLGALETCDFVNNVINIKGKQYQLDSVEFGLSNIFVPNMIYVDPINGDDATASPYSLVKRFQNPYAALNAAVGGDTVVLLAGVYGFVGNMWKPNVNVQIVSGAVPSYISFSDDGTPSTNYVYGDVGAFVTGSLTNLNYQFTNFRLDLPNADIICQSTQPVYARDCANFYFKVKRLDCRNYRCIRLRNVPFYVEIEELDGTLMSLPYYNVYTEEMGAKSGTFNIKLHKSVSLSGTTWLYDTADATGKITYTGEIRLNTASPAGINDAVVVWNGAKVLLKDCKIVSNSKGVHQFYNGQNVNGRIELENCSIDTTSGIEPALKTSSIYQTMVVKNCIAKSKSAKGALEFGIVNEYGDSAAGNLEVRNSILINDDIAAAQPVMNIGANGAILNDVSFINRASVVAGSQSILAGVPSSVKILSGGACGNLSPHINVSNSIVGTNFIADVGISSYL